jgi:myo-inositol-1(or 4)-monophosphatase
VTEHRLALAIDCARQAGALLRSGLGHVDAYRVKDEVDLLTAYDIESEELITHAIHAAYPQDAILSEEAGLLGEGHARWLIDPLDGTTNFAHGLPIFSISIAFQRDERIQLGVIYDPIRDELFHATEGGGAWLNGNRMQVTATERLNDSLVATGFPHDLRKANEKNIDHFGAILLRSHGVRRLGSAALDLAYVACGRLDGYWEVSTWPWDVGAGILMVREAAGRVTHIHSQPLTLESNTAILATNGLIHAEMRAILQAHP